MCSRDPADKGGQVTLRAGTTVLYSVSEFPQRPHHVRGFVDGQVVLRHWSVRKRCWYYTVAYRFEFELGFWSVKARPKRPKQALPG